MRRCAVLAVCLLALTLAGCGQAPPKQQAKPATARPSRAPLAFKGMELYSWKVDDEQWYFSLLMGTNRNKTLQEITDASHTVVGVPALKCKLSALAEGEFVVWIEITQLPDTSPEWVRNAQRRVPQAIVDDVAQYCKGLKIRLYPPRQVDVAGSPTSR